jgi:IS4 transposase
MPGGDCDHPVAKQQRLGIGERYIQRDHNYHVVTPSWCPVREGM